MSTLHHPLPNDVVPPPPPHRRRRRNRHRRRRPPTTENNILQSSVSVSSEEIDLESGELELEMEMKVHCLGKIEKQCRICHLGFDGGGDVIELGCDCKGDLGAAHKQCAETWFKIKGNMTCEICGATAQNVGGEQIIETSHTMSETEPIATGTMVIPTEPTRTCWRGRRIMNILLGCMVFAFIISWLFHFNVLP
ncbi:hypothetical protein M8C21_000518 [Ambrosia artemisiifolia]|uniref:RING-CH-type domain-containing protein n=1 Tax=Ambrosia artemisiifolia TaxID=4212 RepID=A0AAD5C5W2_AMBAR|nr:hypothetical protein M8C21_000518 [Ambrosia artemisiifolia]